MPNLGHQIIDNIHATKEAQHPPTTEHYVKDEETCRKESNSKIHNSNPAYKVRVRLNTHKLKVTGEEGCNTVLVLSKKERRWEMQRFPKCQL